MRDKLRFVVARKNKIIQAPSPPVFRQFNADQVCDEYLAYAERIRPHVMDTTHLLHRGLRAGKKILFEAAQGSLLDVDHGTYPYVTSSNSSPAGIWSGTGVPARNLKRILGVVKAYSSRVGHGPFPTELNDGPDGLGEKIRKTGREYGTVTGRPRRVGWLDAVATRYAAALAGADDIAVMLLDVLSVVKEISICTAYEIDGRAHDRVPRGRLPAGALQTPVYETLPGWSADVSGARKLADLPAAARKYLDRIGDLLDLPIGVVSVGPDREQTIFA